jgi:hypothetical protein
MYLYVRSRARICRYGAGHIQSKLQYIRSVQSKVHVELGQILSTEYREQRIENREQRTEQGRQRMWTCIHACKCLCTEVTSKSFAPPARYLQGVAFVMTLPNWALSRVNCRGPASIRVRDIEYLWCRDLVGVWPA